MDLIASYHAFTWWLQLHSPGADKFLHVNVGLALWVMAALISRRSFASWWTLLPVLLIEGGNEVADFIDGGNWSLSDTLGDMLATWSWPVLLILLFRHRRRVATQDAHSGPVAAEGAALPGRRHAMARAAR